MDEMRKNGFASKISDRFLYPYLCSACIANDREGFLLLAVEDCLAPFHQCL
jgi:hypothetical protein